MISQLKCLFGFDKKLTFHSQRIFTTNMLTGDGIDEAFTWLSENLANHIHQHPIEQEQRSSWFGPLSPREPIERDIYGEVFVLLNKSILKDKERR